MKFLLPSLTVAASLGLLPLHAQTLGDSVKAVLASAPTATLSVQGTGDPTWYFLVKELQHLQAGDLTQASPDPVPVIAKYAEELKAMGVELLVVPVPAKASVYPQKLDSKADPASAPSLGPFLAKLKAAGVESLDLQTAFQAELAKQPDGQLYCATDSHWSPRACEIVAALVAERYRGLPEVVAKKMPDLTKLPPEIREYHGDLLSDGQKATVPKEKLPLSRAGQGTAANLTTVASDPASPLVVLGDSHLQVFRQGGTMLDVQGGFVDHLQVALGTAVHEFTMQAGGADGPRVEIARSTAKNPAFWNGKKVAVWVFTEREITQGKWRVIPAQVKKK
jgi:alginate O-acetyltransferase complex protein AlgJ